MSKYDVAIIGSGPAGVSAAINLKIRNKNIALFGSVDLSLKLSVAARIDNYLGLPEITGKELQKRMEDHLDKMGISVIPQKIQMIYNMGKGYSLAAGQDLIEAKAVILAVGAFSAKTLPGEDQFLGKGVSYCATCDGPLYKGKTVAVLGYSEDAVFEANYLAGVAGKVYYVPLGKPIKGVSSKGQQGETLQAKGLLETVEVLRGKAKAIEGDTAARRILLEDAAVEADGIFVLRDMVAPSSLLPGIQVKGGYIQVDEHMATNLPGCFAAGDCTGKPHQYMRAAGQGQTAAFSTLDYLNSI